MASTSRLSDIIASQADALLSEWMKYQLQAVTPRRDLVRDDDLRDQSGQFLALLGTSLERDGWGADIDGPAWAEMRELLGGLSRTRARQGFSPRETASFVFSLKQPLFERL